MKMTAIAIGNGCITLAACTYFALETFGTESIIVTSAIAVIAIVLVGWIGWRIYKKNLG